MSSEEMITAEGVKKLLDEHEVGCGKRHKKVKKQFKRVGNQFKEVSSQFKELETNLETKITKNGTRTIAFTLGGIAILGGILEIVSVILRHYFP